MLERWHSFFIWATLILTLQGLCNGQTNSPPQFLPGGDMSGFTISEDTAVGTIVYQLKAKDPDGRRVFYYLSGGAFSVDRDSGMVTLVRKLDREKEPVLDIVLTVIDEKTSSFPANTVSVQREIRVSDVNDNTPRFEGTPYSFSVSESTKLFTTVYEGIIITDPDAGNNALVTVDCAFRLTPLACQLFHTQTKQISDGRYQVAISLKGISLDYEITSSFNMILIASDRGGLKSTAEVAIKVDDVQDEPPKFLNQPYSISVNESVPQGAELLTIIATDGDASPEIRRPLKLELISDSKHYFELKRASDDKWIMVASHNKIDREDPEILLNGGIYNIQLKASELVQNNTVGDMSVANVTVVVNDINDQEPSFNLKSISLVIPEDITNGSAVPGLHLVASDTDTGDNARFTLSIEDVNPNNPASKAFTVAPTVAVGRTPVLIKVINADLLDFEDEVKRVFFFNVVASQDGFIAKSSITLSLSDANDNIPFFEKREYNLQIPEDTPSNETIFRLTAFDFDSGIFGKVSYSLKGFGAKKFQVDSDTGEISVAPCDKYESQSGDLNVGCLDFEKQPSYSLTYEAKDGGGKYSTVNLFVEVVDVNDNVPKFVKNVYTRELYERDTVLRPPLYVKATDNDGPSQGGMNGVRYYVKNTNLSGLHVDEVSGEITLTKPIEADFTLNKMTGLIKKLNYEAIVEAKDNGEPSLSSEARVVLYVKSERDGAPMFVNEPYEISVQENAEPGTVIFQVKALDPDGPDSALKYSIIEGAKDNFAIEPTTGEIKISPEANLDRDIYESQYLLKVAVVDSGLPVPLTSTTQVKVLVEDVNNKPPKFSTDSYIVYVQERQIKPGDELIQVRAVDSDSNSKVRYSIDEENITLRGKTGALIHDAIKAYRSLFRVDSTTGVVKVNSHLEESKISSIVVPIVATDINAINPDEQKSVVDLTVYIQTYSDESPVFATPWTPDEPFYYVNWSEEMLIGSTILTLVAKDPFSNKLVVEFEKIKSSDPDNFFSVNSLSGVISLNKRIDYEELPIKQLKLSVKAVSGSSGNGAKRLTSVANIVVNVQDINDNSPIFLKDSYEVEIPESTVHPEKVLTVQATDKDSGEYGQVEYTLSGDGSDVFEVNRTTGMIRLQKGKKLDREVKPLYNVQITATDNNWENSAIRNGNLSTTQRRTSVFAKIRLTDVNDNPPSFLGSPQKTAVPENLAIGSRVGSVSAKDPDLGPNGEVFYELLGFESSTDKEQLFAINSTSGEISSIRTLSGKGRSEPYILKIKAFDKGDPQLNSETTFSIAISDITANDGVPKFVRPSDNETISITENAKPGVFVYQVEATDADSSSSLNGKVMYRFADPSPYFDIDPAKGIISTSKHLGKELKIDREVNQNFTLIVVAFDLGSPPQEAHRILFIEVEDVDDNEPYFERRLDSPPLFITVQEEINIGTEIGFVRAIDKDVGINGAIVYEMFDESDKNAFTIETRSNVGYIKTRKPLDREEKAEYMFAVKARRASKSNEQLSKLKKYTASDLSEIKVQVTLTDINDNPPKFLEMNYLSVVKYDTDLHTNILTFKAIDPDSPTSSEEKQWIEYSLKDVHFIRGKEKRGNLTHVFEMDKNLGTLRNEVPLRGFVDGTFELVVEAKTMSLKNHDISVIDVASAEAKLFILRERDFLKFVFQRKPDEVKQKLPVLKENMEHILKASQLDVNFQDAQFYERRDGSLDFESASTCFLLTKASKRVDSGVLSHQETFKLFRNSSAEDMKKLFEEFGINGIEECAEFKQTAVSSSEVWLFAVAAFIAFFSTLLVIIASNMNRAVKKKIKLLGVDPHRRSQPQPQQQPINAFENHSYGVPVLGSQSLINNSDHQRIYEWQETTNPQIDAVSFRSFPTLR